METNRPVPEGTTRTNWTPLIIIAAVIVLCCCCVMIAVVGIYSFLTIQSIDTQELSPFEITVPAIPDDSEQPTEEPGSELPQDFDAGDPPEGGLGNDTLRNDVWQDVAYEAKGRGCDRPIAEDSTIEVVHEPDTTGVWVEQWTVVCRSGDSYDYEVEYLDETGEDFNITPLP